LEIDPGTVVANRYRITRPLGRGGMGEVFAAENIRTGRPVAVKLLRAESKQKSSAVARFRREARAAGSINSDHVTQVLDVEEDQEHGIVLVFELLEGESLIDRLKRTGPIPYDELHPIVEQVWIGLADAHKAGIIHRDLKPSNVFLERRPDGTVRVKILDFGISKVPKEMGGETLTEMGQSLGTFSFMPPEQIGKAKTVDHRADIYAGATLIYQAMSGQLPYAARNILVMVEMKHKTDARKLSDVMGTPIDPRLEAFLARGLARDPEQRFQSALEALAAWRELRRASSISGEMVAVRQPSHASMPPMSSAAPTASPQILATPKPRIDGRSSPPPDPALGAPPGETDSSAATLAIPIHALQGGTQTPPGIAGLKGTVRMEAVDHAALNRARQSSIPPGMQPQAPVPRIYDEPTAAPGSQEQTTVYRPRQPSVPAAPNIEAQGLVPSQPAPLSQTPPTTPSPKSKPRRSYLPYFFGAIAFALVGFSVAAFVLRYLKFGALPWR
jgi:serine/threonine-protein kinase